MAKKLKITLRTWRFWSVPVLALLFVLGTAVTPSAGAPVAAGSVSDTAATTSTASGQLPDWAIGPFTRYKGNPILKPEGTGWESADTFNPGVVEVKGTFHMLYRGCETGNRCQIGAATSHDGLHFTRYPGNPVIKNTLPNETCGVEDPRLYYLDGTYYSFFTGDFRCPGPFTNMDINEAVSKDGIHWHQLGPAIHENGVEVMDSAVVTSPSGRPVKIDGHYAMYWGTSDNPSGTHLALSTDMRHWSTVSPINLHFPASYAPYELCVAVTDYPTVKGNGLNHSIDLFVAGTLMAHGRWFYAISEADFSAKDLTEEIGQLHQPVLQPTTPYEINGQTPRTVWTNNITFYRGRWWMYYGAGDTVTALATAQLRTPGQP